MQALNRFRNKPRLRARQFAAARAQDDFGMSHGVYCSGGL
jgi:hypothetical protein